MISVVGYLFAAVLGTGFAVALALAFGLFPTGTLVPVLLALTLASIVMLPPWYWLRKTYGRLGLMSPRVRLPLAPPARKRILQSLDIDPEGLPEDHPRRQVRHEIDRLLTAWRRQRTDPALSDDELRSLERLVAYAAPDNADRRHPPRRALSGVREPQALCDIRQAVDLWYAARAEERAEYEAWLGNMGGHSMNHLLADGWVAFLEALPAPDPQLFHMVATDLRNIDQDDRLDAAFWVLGRDDCDKATAADFIRGAVTSGLIDRAAAGRDKRLLAAFAAIVRKYNSGAYKSHSLRTRHAGLDDTSVASLMAAIEAKHGLPALPRPKGLAEADAPPAGTGQRGYTSAFAFRADRGLHLRTRTRDIAALP